NPWGFELNTHRLEGWAKIGKVFYDHPGKSIGLQLSGTYHDQDAQYGVRNYNGAQRSLYANLIYQDIIGNTNHKIKGGLSGMVDNINENFQQNEYNRNETVPGVFVEYSYDYLKKFNLVAGLRGDYDNLYGGFITPRLHVRYAPFSKTTIRASIGRAERTANIFAENMGYMASGRRFEIIEPESGKKPYGLNPEIAWNSGVNLTQKFTLNYKDGTIAVDYYYTNFENQVVVDLENSHYVRFYNLDGASFANSLQVQLDYELIHNLDVRLAYRLYDVRTTYGGTLKEKPLVPKNRAFVNIDYTTKNNWRLGYTVQWIGAKRIPALDNGNMNESYSSSYIQMNAQVSKVLNQRWELYVGGENLTNYTQRNAIVAASTPFGDNFDASMIWGPVMGVNVYGGFRYKIK
ncbi:MAG: TonB-dependent receptor, partial [Bacteroidetes bacterium]|nr:TonB-dependent receptor [Bacteroidota bacterium]